MSAQATANVPHSAPFYPVLILLAALWGGSFLFMRVAVPSLGPAWLIEIRVLLAGLALLPLVAARGQVSVLRREWRWLVLMGLLSAAAPFTLLAYASIALTAGMTSILNATVPLFAVLVALATASETVGVARVAGVALGFIGVVVLVGSPHGGDGVPALSIVAGLVAAFSYVLAANLARRRLTHVPSIVSVTGSPHRYPQCAAPRGAPAVSTAWRLWRNVPRVSAKRIC